MRNVKLCDVKEKFTSFVKIRSINRGKGKKVWLVFKVLTYRVINV